MSVASRFLYWILPRGGAGAFRPPVPVDPPAPTYEIFWPGLAAMQGIDWPGEAAPIDWPGI